jgi:hypothetical protein
MMISEQARQGLKQIFTRAASSSLVLDAADRIEIESLPDAVGTEAASDRLLVLTVASYVFRLIVIFHIRSDPATRHYFSRGNPDCLLDEAIGEVGNLCCGAINRDLGNHFLHMGMSTPYLLEGRCITFLQALRPTCVSRYRISINDEVNLQATLCWSAYAPIDFKVETQLVAECTGELELF